MHLEYFRLIDRILEFDPVGRTIQAEAVVPTQSTVFEGHFPGHPLMPGQIVLLSVKLSYGLIGTSQSATSYPRNYTDTTVAAAWTQASFSGTQFNGNGSGFFIADAKVVA